MMVKLAYAAAIVLFSLLPGLNASGNEQPSSFRKEFREAADLYGRGMYERAGAIFGEIYEKTGDFEAEGWKVLCAVRLSSAGYPAMMDSYITKYPCSGLIPQIRLYHGMNQFDSGDYASALATFGLVARGQIYRKQVTEFLFRKAYCTFETGDYALAVKRFSEVESRPASDYTAPARYSLGYINYLQGNFGEAAGWFGKAAADYRFAEIASYYVFECRFMEKDYAYVIDKGPSMLGKVPSDRVPSLVRMISESYLVEGDAENARKYYEMNLEADAIKDRDDFFYAGSLLFAVKDYQGAIDQYSMMKERTDSIGQIANYNMGFSYIQTKNKVAAMDAFRDAAMAGSNPEMTRDAWFNYAKLAFDLNSDSSAFDEYLKRYPDTRRGDRIYSYIAMAALYRRDYAAAVDAYDNIDELDPDMRSNYMKANYMRANQLISGGAWRASIPYLKAAAWYSDRREPFNQLSRFWLAEAYYRDGRFQDAASIYTDLYNTSALYGMPESFLVPYGLAYCSFKQENWPLAIKWFSEYLGGNGVLFRKEALLRKGDCLFVQKKYREAYDVYSEVLEGYYNVNDIYPYYQAAVSLGLAGDAKGKTALLERVDGASPSSAFYAEAMYELGRSYVNDGAEDKAVRVLEKMLGTVKDSTYMAMALIDLGMISRNRSETDRALGYYKKVVSEFSLSGYAEDALLAIESIYQSRNDPDGYLDYIASIGKGGLKTEDEKEMMIFNAAEQIFLSENYRKALVSLQSYMDRYPSGSRLYQAEFYMAESYKALGELEKSADHYANVMKNGSGSFVEIATLNYSNISYSLQQYKDAYEGYSELLDNAQIGNNVFTARLGMMRSAYGAKMYNETIDAAAAVLGDQRCTPEIKGEAEYLSAKSMLATSRRDEAFAMLAAIAADPSTEYGAEAAYLIIQDSYDKGQFEDVENKVYSFAESSAQQYWLARAFIVLGDSFVERGDYEQAKATFESVLTGYVPEKEDDINDNVKLRLSKLEEMMKEEL